MPDTKGTEDALTPGQICYNGEYVNSKFDGPILTFDLAAVDVSPDKLEVKWCFLNDAHISVFYLKHS